MDMKGKALPIGTSVCSWASLLLEARVRAASWTRTRSTVTMAGPAPRCQARSYVRAAPYIAVSSASPSNMARA